MSPIRRFLWLELFRSSIINAFHPLRSLFLLLAIQYFYANPQIKGLIFSADFIGFFIAPVGLSIFSFYRSSVATSLSCLYFLSAAGLIVISLTNDLFFFVAGILLCVASMAIDAPLITTIWQSNVRSSIRGKLFANVSTIGLIVRTLSGLLISIIVAKDLGNYIYITIFFSVALFVMAILSRCFKAEKLSSVSRLPWGRFALLKKNKFVAWMLFAWFIMGAANLGTLPLRTEYIAGGHDFAAYDPFLVLMLIEVVPNFCRMLTLKLWGKLFDSINFLIYRNMINVLFLLTYLLFFTPSLISQLIACICFGVSSAGGYVGWNLWLTKYVPAKELTDYMSIHTFLTGLRGILFPFVGFSLLGIVSFQELAWVAAFMTSISITIFVVLYRTERKLR